MRYARWGLRSVSLMEIAAWAARNAARNRLTLDRKGSLKSSNELLVGN
jgi:hypothetical protein